MDWWGTQKERNRVEFGQSICKTSGDPGWKNTWRGHKWSTGRCLVSSSSCLHLRASSYPFHSRPRSTCSAQLPQHWTSPREAAWYLPQDFLRRDRGARAVLHGASAAPAELARVPKHSSTWSRVDTTAWGTVGLKGSPRSQHMGAAPTLGLKCPWSPFRAGRRQAVFQPPPTQSCSVLMLLPFFKISPGKQQLHSKLINFKTLIFRIASLLLLFWYNNPVYTSYQKTHHDLYNHCWYILIELFHSEMFWHFEQDRKKGTQRTN